MRGARAAPRTWNSPGICGIAEIHNRKGNHPIATFEPTLPFSIHKREGFWIMHSYYFQTKFRTSPREIRAGIWFQSALMSFFVWTIFLFVGFCPWQGQCLCKFTHWEDGGGSFPHTCIKIFFLELIQISKISLGSEVCVCVSFMEEGMDTNGHSWWSECRLGKKRQ